MSQSGISTNKMDGARSWQRFAIRRIEDLANGVLGAELEAIQMAGPPVRGSLAFAAGGGVIFSSGLIRGRIAVTGPLSPDAITLGIALRLGRRSRYWLNAAAEGDVGVVLPGDEHDAVYGDGSLYVTAALSARRLKQEAEREGLVLDTRMTARTGLHPRPVAGRVLAALRREVALIHRGGAAFGPRQSEAGGAVLRTVIEHYALLPAGADRRVHPVGRARVVSKAREFIRKHLARPITLESIAGAAGTSTRTLSRAFVEVLEDTPLDYVRRLRLHRIRRDLAWAGEARTSISAIAARWGMTEPGRMSGWYRDVFGELPSATLASHLAHKSAGMDLM